MDLTEFLLARIVDDEEQARTSEPFRFGVWRIGGRAERTIGDHVLAECDAKRRIVAIHAAVIHDVYPPDVAPACRTCGEFSEYARPWPCPTIRLLALPYADHPDYDPAWRT